MRIGAYLRRHREQVGLNVTQLAAALGVGERTIFAIEAGERDTRSSLLLRYAALVGASGDDLVGMFAAEVTA